MSLLVSLPLLAAGACAPAAQDAPAEAAARPAIEWSVPGLWLTGAEFSATVRIEAPEAGLALPVWALGPAAFEVGGEPLGERSGDGSVFTADFVALGGQDVASVVGVGESARGWFGQPERAFLGGVGEAGLGFDVESAPFVEAGGARSDR